jgi:uncharacterized membrane protein YccF (DUF307 family)
LAAKGREFLSGPRADRLAFGFGMKFYRNLMLARPPSAVSAETWDNLKTLNRYLPMPALRFLLNVLWVFTGGLWTAAAWIVGALIMAITIIGLPWARAAFNIALYTFLPFGHRAVSRARFTGREDIGTGPLGVLGNLIWLILAGWWLAILHLVNAAALAITIVGLPFAWAHIKLAAIALWPIGRMIVTVEEAESQN